MRHRFFTLLAVFAGVIAAPVVSGQAPTAKAPAGKPQTVKAKPAPKTFRTPWGDPDLQGVWNDATSTPLQRPGDVGSKQVLNDEEAAEFQTTLANGLTRDRRDGGPEVDVNRAYNDHWMDSRRLKITAD